MGASSYSDINESLRHLYLEAPRPWVVGFSGGKGRTMLDTTRPESMAGRGRCNALHPQQDSASSTTRYRLGVFRVDTRQRLEAEDYYHETAKTSQRRKGPKGRRDPASVVPSFRSFSSL